MHRSLLTTVPRSKYPASREVNGPRTRLRAPRRRAREPLGLERPVEERTPLLAPVGLAPLEEGTQAFLALVARPPRGDPLRRLRAVGTFAHEALRPPGGLRS